MSNKELVEAKDLLVNAQKVIPWCLASAAAIGTALPVGAFFGSAFGVAIGIVIGLSIGLGLAYAALAATNAIIVILNHLSENDSKE